MADAQATKPPISFSQDKILTALYGANYASVDNARAKIQARFEGYIKEASHALTGDNKGTLLFTDAKGSERILASNIDTAMKDNGINLIDGGKGTDIIDFDSYYIDSVRDIDITKTGDNYTIVVKDSDGKEHTYNVKSIEGFRFVDKNGELHKYRIFDDPKVSTKTSGYGAYVINYSNTTQYLATSGSSDYIKITTSEKNYKTLGGDDIIDYDATKIKSGTVTINGGAGADDTLLLKTLTKADIKSATLDSNVTTITLTDNRVIKITGVETIVLKDWAGSPSELRTMKNVKPPAPTTEAPKSTNSEYKADVPATTTTPEINYIEGDVLMGEIDGDDLKQGGFAAVGTEGKRDVVILKGCRSDYVFSMDEKGRIKVTLPGNSTRKYMYLTKIDEIHFTKTGKAANGIEYHDDNVEKYRLQYNGKDTGDKADQTIGVLALSGAKLKLGAAPSADNSYSGSDDNDFFRGSNANDTYQGGAGSDVYVMSGGNDTIEEAPGVGNDLFVVLGNRADYKIEKLTDGKIKITSNNNSNNVTTMTGIERIQFNDGEIETKDIKVAT